LKDTVLFQLYLDLHWRDFSETLYLTLFTNELQAMYDWLPSINNYGHFTWRTK